MRATWSILVAIAALLVPLEHTRADGKDAQEILRKMDEAQSGFEDQYMLIRLTVREPSGDSRSFEFKFYQKGAEKRLIRFISGDNKGMAMLTEGPSKVYVYLPGMRKVRKIATHALKQNVAGSDFSHQDMAAVKWSDLYRARLVSEDKETVTLECTPKPGRDAPYPRVVMTIDKKTHLQRKVEYYDEKGHKIKTMVASNPKEFEGGHVMNTKVVMTDARTGHSTTMEILEFKPNQGLRDSMFTVRQLLWGR